MKEKEIKLFSEYMSEKFNEKPSDIELGHFTFNKLKERFAGTDVFVDKIQPAGAGNFVKGMEDMVLDAGANVSIWSGNENLFIKFNAYSGNKEYEIQMHSKEAKKELKKFHEKLINFCFMPESKSEEREIKLFTEYIELSNKGYDFLTESENAEVDQWVREFQEEFGTDLSNLDEGFLGKLVGGVTGFLVGPTIGKIIANALGVEKGILYDMFTSRLVNAALGTAIAKSFEKNKK